MKISFFLISILFFSFQISAREKNDDVFVFHNRYADSPRDFKAALKNYLKEVYESDQPINADEILGFIKKCNLTLSLKDPQTYKEGFDVCMDFYYFNLWAGSGGFNLKFENELNQRITLSGVANFIGGQIHFPYTLNSRIIFEGKYWYLPTLATSDSVSQDLNNASILETNLVYQTRPRNSSWSHRLGINFTKSPVVKNLSESLLLENVDLNYKTFLTAGPLIGMKYATDRSKMIKHLAFFDLTPFLLSDGVYFKNLAKNYSLKLGYKYFLHKRWALTLDMEKNHMLTDDEIEIDNLLYGIGIQLFTF